MARARTLAELAATLTEELFLRARRSRACSWSRWKAAATRHRRRRRTSLSGSIRETDGVARITARLVRVDTGTQLWSAAYDEPLTALSSPEDQRRVARLIALVAEPYGPIFEAELERIDGLAVEALSTRDCVLLFYEYRRVLGVAQHARAVDCFEQAAAHQPDTVETWARLAVLYAEAWPHDFVEQRDAAPLLERAREAARHAMDIDGDNLHANLALAVVQYFGGADARDVAERVLATWPENAEAQAYIGAMFVLSGETARGKQLVETAIEWTPEVPSGYYATLSLAALREQRYDDALASALRIDSPDWPLGHLICRGRVALGGRPDLGGPRADARSSSSIRRSRRRCPTCCAAGASSQCSWRRSSGDLPPPRRGRRPSLHLAVRRRQVVDQALKLEREVVELRHGNARELHELDELLEALSVVRVGDAEPTFRL